KEAKMRTDENVSRAINLPSGYGKDRIVAMVRDPWWVFVYWEITPRLEQAVKDEISKHAKVFEKSILRIYDITNVKNFNGGNAGNYFDITLENLAKNWYLDLSAPDRCWCIEIGAMTKDGSFYPMARSNIVKTPRFGMSDILDEKWMLAEDEYWWLFGVSGGFGVGKSSFEMKEMLKKQLQEWISSGGIVSFASHILKQKR
ncbi:MAG: DUF4912 domain-containing protein, partial [Candidatus Omnitrophica bacterium]|nr:DUF4912 domain-containing protein [Candidatus Omnitrophota bacterium]